MRRSFLAAILSVAVIATLAIPAVACKWDRETVPHEKQFKMHYLEQSAPESAGWQAALDDRPYIGRWAAGAGITFLIAAAILGFIRGKIRQKADAGITKPRWIPWRTMGRITAFGIVGTGAGWLVATLAGLGKLPPPDSHRFPYPHVVPKSEDAVSLRFAMVHDAIHERLPRHGEAYYKERNRLTQKAMKELLRIWSLNEPPESFFDLTDDHAVGLDMVGEHDEAIRLMHDKLRQQLDNKVPREQMYSTHANLGTFLILGPFRRIRPGNEQDKATLREGLQHIKTAIEINPESHFGREIWQMAIIEYMIALYDDPKLLFEFDMIGNRLDRDLSGEGQHPLTDYGQKPGKAGPQRWGIGFGGVAQARKAARYLRNRETWHSAKEARKAITLVGAEDGWEKKVEASNKAPVPFDEPTLGIVGMWRIGGGAHPYFAVALGETMLRVGQRYLAWSAFERAARLANLAWPDPDLQDRFAEHCRRRQSAIEATLPADEVELLRPGFDAELKRGQEFQAAYQHYEVEQIAAGKSIEDPHFYDAFDAKHGAIASPAGHADWFRASEKWMLSWPWTAAVLFAGLFALAAAIRMPRPEPAV